MLFKRMFKKPKSDQLVKAWLKTQSDPDDAIVYLIQKELYENGNRDLAYIIPRYRNETYFEQQALQKIDPYTVASSVRVDYEDALQEEANNFYTESSALTQVRAIKEKQKIAQTPPNPTEHVVKVKAVHHVPDHKTEDVILTQQNDRDLSHLDLTCFDD